MLYRTHGWWDQLRVAAEVMENEAVAFFKRAARVVAVRRATHYAVETALFYVGSGLELWMVPFRVMREW